jgi:hypothetical protein
MEPPIRGLVLEGYGAGTIPDGDPEWLAALADAAARGVVITVVSQCADGRVDLGAYATSGPLIRAGDRCHSVVAHTDILPRCAATSSWTERSPTICSRIRSCCSVRGSRPRGA